MMLLAVTGTARNGAGTAGTVHFFRRSRKKRRVGSKRRSSEEEFANVKQTHHASFYATIYLGIFLSQITFLKMLIIAGSSTLRCTKTEAELPKVVHVIQSRSRSQSHPELPHPRTPGCRIFSLSASFSPTLKLAP